MLAATEPGLEPRSPAQAGFPRVTASPQSPSALSSRYPRLPPGLVAVFEHHRKKGYADLYSLHSWCGILVFALFFAQVSPRGPTVAGRGREQAPNRLRPGVRPEVRPGCPRAARSGRSSVPGSTSPFLPVARGL